MKRSRTAPSVRLLKLILRQKWFKALHVIRRNGRELKAEYQQMDQLDQAQHKKEATIVVERAQHKKEATIVVERSTLLATTGIVAYSSSIASLASPASQDDTCKKELYLRHILPEAIFQKAPKYILKAIIEISPSILLTLPDENGRLPLHAACLDGASLSTVKMLLSLETPKGIHCDENFSEQASAVDYTNRTPLHYAIKNLISYCRKESGVKFIYADPDFDEMIIEKREKGKEELLYIIHVLLQAHPDAVLHVDEQNDTPIDLLQKARRLYRKKKRYYNRDIETILEDTCIMLRVKAVEVYRRRKLRYELLGCDSYDKSQGIWWTKSKKGPQIKYSGDEMYSNNGTSESIATTTHCSSSPENNTSSFKCSFG